MEMQQVWKKLHNTNFFIKSLYSKTNIMNIAILIAAIIVTSLIFMMFIIPMILQMQTSEFTIYMNELEPCLIELCRNNFCFGLQVTDCQTMYDKCSDEGYLEQWNIQCFFD